MSASYIKPSRFGFIVLYLLAVAGWLHWPKGVIAVGVVLLAVSPIQSYFSMTQEHPEVDADAMIREFSINVVCYAIIAATLAYMAGLGFRVLVG